jgi:hypothetical protein
MSNPNGNHVDRTARLQWVPIASMHISPLSQRELRPARAAQIAANLDIEQLGAPTVSERDGKHYVIDGQHRIEALRLLGWADQSVQCWTYAGLTAEEEAEVFLKLNDTLRVDAFSKFRVGVQAGRAAECAIDRIVRDAGLRVAHGKTGAISAVGALQTVYRGPGPGALARSLRIIRDAYGDAGYVAKVIVGMGLLCARYEGQLDDERLVKKLGAANGGLNGLLNRARATQKATGKTHPHCVAAAAVDIYNSGAGAKLASYWRTDPQLQVLAGAS